MARRQRWKKEDLIELSAPGSFDDDPLYRAQVAMTLIRRRVGAVQAIRTYRVSYFELLAWKTQAKNGKLLEEVIAQIALLKRELAKVNLAAVSSHVEKQEIELDILEAERVASALEELSADRSLEPSR